MEPEGSLSLPVVFCCKWSKSDDDYKVLEELSDFDLCVTTFNFYQAQDLSDYPEKYQKIPDYKKWLQQAEQNPNDMFVVTGSLYFISEVRNYLLNQ